MFRHLAVALVLAGSFTLPSFSQDSDSHDKNFDVHSSVGDMHVGKDVDARKIGLPVYPGARLKTDDKDSTPANLSIFTEAFGFKLVVASYSSDEAPAKIVDFYRDKLKKYGKVLECHTQKHGGDVEMHDDDNDNDKDTGKSKELKCDENSGPVTELKVGTEDNQRVVAVEPADGKKGTTFALVYVHSRGKRGDI